MSLLPTGTRSLPENQRRIIIALFAVGIAWGLGTLGFYLIEGWPLVDSLYVAAQTITTVGYGDISPKTTNGRIFSTIFMLVAVGVVLYALGTVVQAIVQSEMLATLGQRRLSRKMSKLRNHYIICGAGRVGSHLIQALQESQDVFLVIERDPQKVAQLTDMGVLVLVRDATLEQNLVEAGVEWARGLAACLSEDADNVYVVLSARDLNPNLHIVARAAEEQAESKLIRAGANRVVAPTIIGGHRMAVALTKPAVDDFIGSITANKVEQAFEQLDVEPSSSLVGQKLSQTNLRSELDIVIVSIIRKDGQMLFNPSGDTVIETGDTLIAIGHVDSLVKLASMARAKGVSRNSNVSASESSG